MRVMTPEGIVRTYAGRGSRTSAADTIRWCSESCFLLEVARFRDPTGIAYDETKKVFYVLDTVGRSIRTIGMEEAPEEESGTTGGESGEATGGEATTAN